MYLMSRLIPTRLSGDDGQVFSLVLVSILDSQSLPANNYRYSNIGIDVPRGSGTRFQHQTPDQGGPALANGLSNHGKFLAQPILGDVY